MMVVMMVISSLFGSVMLLNQSCMMLENYVVTRIRDKEAPFGTILNKSKVCNSIQFSYYSNMYLISLLNVWIKMKKNSLTKRQVLFLKCKIYFKKKN